MIVVMRFAATVVLFFISIAGGPARATTDELVELNETLIAVNKESNEIRDEIKNLEKVSKERARKISVLRAKIKMANAQTEKAQDELIKAKARAGELEKTEGELNRQATASAAQLAAVTQELNKVKAEYAKEDARHKALMAKIEADKKEELKRKADLTARVRNLEGHLQKQSKQRESSQQKVDQLYNGNEKMYERLKGN